MSGEIEMDVCDFCHNVKHVERTILRPTKYVKTDWRNKNPEDKELYNQGNYFIIIRTCNECGVPKID
jgi:hypothetical protein